MGSTAPSKNENLKKHPVKCTFYQFLLTANYPTSTTNTHTQIEYISSNYLVIVAVVSSCIKQVIL